MKKESIDSIKKKSENDKKVGLLKKVNIFYLIVGVT